MIASNKNGAIKPISISGRDLEHLALAYDAHMSSLALSPFQQAFLASFTGGVSSPAVPASVTAELVRLRALPVLKLRRECKKKGLNAKGGKAEVLERLEAVVRQAIPAGLPAAAGVASEAEPVGSVDDLFALLARKGESKVSSYGEQC